MGHSVSPSGRRRNAGSREPQSSFRQTTRPGDYARQLVSCRDRVDTQDADKATVPVYKTHIMKRAASLVRALLLLREPTAAQRFALLFGLILLTSASSPSQSSQSQGSPSQNSTGQLTLDFPSATRPQAEPMTVDDVIRLSKAGLSDDVIIQQIRKQGQRFNLSTDQLVQLKSASVSERVIQVMIDPTKDTSPSFVEKKAGSPAPPQQAVQRAAQDTGVPKDVQSLGNGFYYQSSQGWKKLEPISMAGGGLKHVGKMFVPGLTPQMVWTFRGTEAPVQIEDKRPTFCIKELPSLANIAGRTERDLVIVRFDKKKDHRELRLPMAETCSRTRPV